MHSLALAAPAVGGAPVAGRSEPRAPRTRGRRASAALGPRSAVDGLADSAAAGLGASGRARCRAASCAALAGVALLGACDGPSAPWSALRDALTTGRGDVFGLARAADAQRSRAADAAAAPDPVASIDRARALRGDDALVAARYDLADGVVVATDCGPLFAPSGAPDLAGWLARCRAADGDDAARTAPDARLVTVPGQPALAAWLPARGELRVHPDLVALTGDDATALGLVAAPLLDATPSCEADLAAWCARCPTGTEAGCAPLFSSQAEAQGCAALDAAAAAAAAPGGPVPDWRARYCDWRYLATDPRARFVLIQVDPGQGGGASCWDRSVAVRDLASLLEAFAGFNAGCASTMANARAFVDSGDAFPRAQTPGWHETLARCSAFQRDVVCEACTPDPEGVCGSYFERSNLPEDCYDLARAEAHGGGFAALCLYGAAKSFIDRGCFNLYDPCWYAFIGGTEDLTSFEQLVGSAPGFFAAATAERCIAQAERCLAGDPLPDFDPGAQIPTAAPPPPSSAQEDGKCPL